MVPKELEKKSLSVLMPQSNFYHLPHFSKADLNYYFFLIIHVKCPVKLISGSVLNSKLIYLGLYSINNYCQKNFIIFFDKKLIVSK